VIQYLLMSESISPKCRALPLRGGRHLVSHHYDIVCPHLLQVAVVLRVPYNALNGLEARMLELLISGVLDDLDQTLQFVRLYVVDCARLPGIVPKGKDQL